MRSTTKCGWGTGGAAPCVRSAGGYRVGPQAGAGAVPTRKRGGGILALNAGGAAKPGRGGHRYRQYRQPEGLCRDRGGPPKMPLWNAVNVRSGKNNSPPGSSEACGKCKTRTKPTWYPTTPTAHTTPLYYRIPLDMLPS